MSVCLGPALKYAARGWHVLPVKATNKAPYTAHGVYDATTDEETILGWWKTWPSANVAIACGPSGLVVIDCDVKNGIDGIATWRDYCIEHGIPEDGTLTTITPSGGRHRIYKAPPGVEIDRKIGFLPGVDILAGPFSYFVAPPSRRDVNEYRWN